MGEQNRARNPKSPTIPWKPRRQIGEGGIRTHGTVTRTTVFETAKIGHGDRSGYTSLENRTIKMQTTLVACPRNHLYRTGRCLRSGRLAREIRMSAYPSKADM